MRADRFRRLVTQSTDRSTQLHLLVPLSASCGTNGVAEEKPPVTEPDVQVKTQFIDTACDWTKPI